MSAPVDLQDGWEQMKAALMEAPEAGEPCVHGVIWRDCAECLTRVESVYRDAMAPSFSEAH